MRPEAKANLSTQTIAVADRPRWPQRLLRLVILYAVVPSVSVILIMALFQRRLMYQPSVARSLQVAIAGLDPQRVLDVQIAAPEGAILRGWLLKASQPEGLASAPSGRKSTSESLVPLPARQDVRHPPLVLYFPGNAGNRFERRRDLEEIASCGCDVLIFDYRGYGDSSGAPSETRLSADARLVWSFAQESLGYPPEQIIIFGESLGGAVALSLWSEESRTAPQPAALILNATFASMSQVVAWHYPWFPFRLVLLDRWPSIQRIGRVSVPLTVFHGTADEIVPVEQARELARAAAGARLIEIVGGQHNGIPMHQLRQELLRVFPDPGASEPIPAPGD